MKRKGFRPTFTWKNVPWYMHSVLYIIYAICNIHNSGNSYFVGIFKYKVSQKKIKILFTICILLYAFHYMSNSQILVTWNFSTNHDIVPWIEEKLHIEVELQQFSMNNMYVRVPGKLSEILQSRGQYPISCLIMGQICPLGFTHFRTLSPGLENIGSLECVSGSFSGALTYLLSLENSWNSDPMCSSSPIQGTM